MSKEIITWRYDKVFHLYNTQLRRFDISFNPDIGQSEAKLEYSYPKESKNASQNYFSAVYNFKTREFKDVKHKERIKEVVKDIDILFLRGGLNSGVRQNLREFLDNLLWNQGNLEDRLE